MKVGLGAVIMLLVLSSQAARAELPDPVRAMIEAAIATGDTQKVATVVELARQIHPNDAAEIEGIQHDFLWEQARLAAVREAEEEAELRRASLLEMWDGKGQIGAFRSSGNSDTVGVSASLALKRVGLEWIHKLSAAVDYQSSSGRTTREQILAAYEPRYQISPAIFAFGLGQYERDRFRGFLSRYSLSGGIGGALIDKDALHLSVKAGPTWRWVEFVRGTEKSHIAGLGALDFRWQMAERVSLTEDASLVVEKGNTSILSTTGLETGISDELSARLSYTVDFDSDPPAGAVQTDTLTRFTLVYDF